MCAHVHLVKEHFCPNQELWWDFDWYAGCRGGGGGSGYPRDILNQTRLAVAILSSGRAVPCLRIHPIRKRMMHNASVPMVYLISSTWTLPVSLLGLACNFGVRIGPRVHSLVLGWETLYTTQHALLPQLKSRTPHMYIVHSDLQRYANTADNSVFSEGKSVP